MRLLHFVNSILLIMLVLIFLLSIVMPKNLENLEGIDSSKHSTTDVVLFKLSRPAVLAWEKINEKPNNAINLALIILSFNAFIVCVLILFFRRKNKGQLSVNVQGGKVSITINAIEDSLRRCLKGDPQIDPTKVIVTAGASKIKVTAWVTLRESNTLHHLDENIIAHMKNHLEKIFPIQKPVNYEVVIRRLKASGTPMGVPGIGSAPAKVEETPSAPIAPIEQPQYPSNVDPEKEEQ